MNGSGNDPVAVTMNPQAGQDFSIGGAGNWDGAIDQVTIWDYDIGAAGVLELYKAGEGIYY
jgi:hypothetical protein